MIRIDSADSTFRGLTSTLTITYVKCYQIWTSQNCTPFNFLTSQYVSYCPCRSWTSPRIMMSVCILSYNRQQHANFSFVWTCVAGQLSTLPAICLEQNVNPGIRSRLFHCTLESHLPPHECREISKYTINSNSSKLELRTEGGGVVPHTLFEILRQLHFFLILCFRAS